MRVARKSRGKEQENVWFAAVQEGSPAREKFRVYAVCGYPSLCTNGAEGPENGLAMVNSTGQRCSKLALRESSIARGIPSPNANLASCGKPSGPPEPSRRAHLYSVIDSMRHRDEDPITPCTASGEIREKVREKTKWPRSATAGVWLERAPSPCAASPLAAASPSAASGASSSG